MQNDSHVYASSNWADTGTTRPDWCETYDAMAFGPNGGNS